MPQPQHTADQAQYNALLESIKQMVYSQGADSLLLTVALVFDEVAGQGDDYHPKLASKLRQMVGSD